MALLEGDIVLIQSFYFYLSIIRFKYIKTQYIFIKRTSFDEVVIMLHKFDSNSEQTFLTLPVIFGYFLKIVHCDKRLILKEHLTFPPSLVICDPPRRNQSHVSKQKIQFLIECYTALF